jgi:hypothetical protein
MSDDFVATLPSELLTVGAAENVSPHRDQGKARITLALAALLEPSFQISKQSREAFCGTAAAARHANSHRSDGDGD